MEESKLINNKELLGKCIKKGDDIEEKAENFHKLVSGLKDNFSSYKTTINDGATKIMQMIETLNSLAKVFDQYFNANDISKGYDELKAKIKKWGILQEEYEKSYNEAINKDDTDIASEESKELIGKYEISLEVKRDKLMKEIDDYNKLIITENKSKKSKIDCILDNLNSIIRTTVKIENEIKEKNKGYDNIFEKDSNEIANPIQDLEKMLFYLDTANNEWILYDTSYITNYCQIKIETKLNHCAHLVKVNNSIYVTGGTNSQSNPLANGYVFNLKGDLTQGTPIADMVYPKKYHTLINANDREIISIGGEGFYYCINQCESYDIKSDKWKEIPKLNEGKKCVTACMCNNSIYCFGGVIGIYSTDTIEKLEYPLNDKSKWDIIHVADSIYNIYSAGICSLDSKIFIFGGNTKNMYIFDLKNLKFDLITKEIQRICSFRDSTYILDEKEINILGSNKKMLTILTKNFDNSFRTLEGVSNSSSYLSSYSPKKSSSMIST